MRPEEERWALSWWSRGITALLHHRASLSRVLLGLSARSGAADRRLHPELRSRPLPSPGEEELLPPSPTFCSVQPIGWRVFERPAPPRNSGSRDWHTRSGPALCHTHSPVTQEILFFMI